VIVTGQRTGHGADLGDLATVRASTELPLLVGSGVTAETVVDLLEIADAVIVASALKEGGVWWNPVDEGRVRAFMARLG
jgi:predicted TIM-barrel enzyme